MPAEDAFDWVHASVTIDDVLILHVRRLVESSTWAGFGCGLNVTVSRATRTYLPGSAAPRLAT